MNPVPRTLPPARRVLSALLLAHVLAVLVLAASPRLHHWLHGDLEDDDDCAVVLFLHGGVDGAAGPVLVPGFVAQSVGWVLLAFKAEDFVPSVFATGKVFEHGPPRVG